MGVREEEAESVFAAGILMRQAEAMIRELTLLRQRPVDESIHDTRVQSRRMRAALETFRDLYPQRRWQALYDTIRKITRNLGAAREIEVSLQWLQSLAEGGDMAEKLCHEYLEERLGVELERLQKKMNKKLRRINTPFLSARIRSLLSGTAEKEIGSPQDSENPREHLAGRRRRAVQSELFPMKPMPLERGQRILGEMILPILALRTRSQFRRASDRRLHKIRIATKRLRYAMEIFDGVWPTGLQEEIRLARILQDASGHHQDLAALRVKLRAEMRRLTRHRAPHLAFQVGRLLARIEERKADLRKEILPALLELQSRLELLGEAAETARQRQPVE